MADVSNALLSLLSRIDLLGKEFLVNMKGSRCYVSIT